MSQLARGSRVTLATDPTGSTWIVEGPHCHFAPERIHYRLIQGERRYTAPPAEIATVEPPPVWAVGDAVTVLGFELPGTVQAVEIVDDETRYIVALARKSEKMGHFMFSGVVMCGAHQLTSEGR